MPSRPHPCHGDHAKRHKEATSRHMGNCLGAGIASGPGNSLGNVRAAVLAARGLQPDRLRAVGTDRLIGLVGDGHLYGLPVVTDVVELGLLFSGSANAQPPLASLPFESAHGQPCSAARLHFWTALAS